MSAELSINEVFKKIWIRFAVILAFLYFAIYLPGHQHNKLQEQLQQKENHLQQTQSMFLAVNNELNRLTNNFNDSVFYKSELTCLADNIYYESRGESLAGQLAVATVTMNRVFSNSFPNTICDVVHQKRYNPNKDKMICQFSWVCEEVAKPNKKVYSQVLELAEKVMFDNHRSNIVNDALYFHAKYVNPGWTRSQIIASVGNHIFYKDHK